MVKSWNHRWSGDSPSAHEKRKWKRMMSVGQRYQNRHHKECKRRNQWELIDKLFVVVDDVVVYASDEGEMGKFNRFSMATCNLCRKKGRGEIKTNRRDKSENENLHSRKKKSIESNDDEISLWRKVHFCCLVIKNQQHWPSTYKHLHICINGYSYMKKFRVLRGNNSHFLLFTGWENSTREIELLDWERESHTVYDQTDQ